VSWSHMMTILDTAISYLRMIKFSHTIFALPFAFASLVLAHRVVPLNGKTVLWIVIAMIGARSAAMGFNRLADAEIDAKNLRTMGREIPSKIISTGQVALFVVCFALLFHLAAAMLSQFCFLLSFPLLGILLFYSYTKRFTWLSHIWLGLAIGMVPMAVWVAVTGTFAWKIGVLSLALLTYIAGFDILYACQDVEFDIGQGLYSIPAAFGIKKALFISSALHVISVISLASLYWLFALHGIYLFFVGLIAVLFVIEHRLVNPQDFSKINMAFFHVNSVIAVLVFIAILAGGLAFG
jgi:4-hydroxybenzoate polyprenyltransferase